MPYSDPKKQREAVRNAVRKFRSKISKPINVIPAENVVPNITLTITELYDKQIHQSKLTKVLQELDSRSILSIHIYLFRPILKYLLVSHFKKRIFKINNKTELIMQSYNLVIRE